MSFKYGPKILGTCLIFKFGFPDGFRDTFDILNCGPEHRVDHRGAGRHLPAAGPHAQGAGGNDGEIGGMYRVALAV